MTSRPFTLSLIACFATICFLTGCGAGPQDVLSDAPGDDLDAVPDELIVLVNAGVSAAEKAALFTEVGVTELDDMPDLSASLVGFEPDQRDRVEAALAASFLVEAAMANHIYEEQRTPGDPLLREQWHHEAINSSGAWALTTGSEDVIVAVLDSGVDADHEDLHDNLHQGISIVDDAGWRDVRGHGTAIAGIIGAGFDNRIGGAGLAPDCPLLAIRVSDDQGRTTSWKLATGIALAVERGARVINISFAPIHNNRLVLRQARQARLAERLVVISAGNTGWSSTAEDAALARSALFVGAVNASDRLAIFSTTGNFVDLTAPGQSITTTSLDGTYEKVTGTSYAAPIVSGVAALIWSLQPEFRTVTVEQILFDTAVDLGEPGRDDAYGRGRVDAAAAVQRATEIVEQDDTEPPTVRITAPADGAGIGGSTIVRVSADDDTDVAVVTLYVDGQALATDVFPPHDFYLDTSKYAAGEHVISAVAADTSGNTATDEIVVSFTRDTGDTTNPFVRLVQPSDGATVRGVVTVLAEASDNTALATAELLIDGQTIAKVNISGTESSIAINWNTTTTANGLREVAIKVTDTSGNSRSASVSVTVNN